MHCDDERFIGEGSPSPRPASVVEVARSIVEVSISAPEHAQTLVFSCSLADPRDYSRVV